MDEAYRRALVVPFERASGFLWRRMDDAAVDAAVNAAGRATLRAGQAARPTQTGFVRQYGLSILVGATAIALYVWLVAR